VGADATGNVLWRTRLTRQASRPLIAQRPPVRIGRGAWGGAPYGARRIREQGHEGKRTAPPFVTPFVQANRNDRREAAAIAEAGARPTMRCVPTQAIGHQDLRARHRVRERRIGARTALIKAVHGLMPEDGLVMPTGVSKLRQAAVDTRASAKDTLTAVGRAMVAKPVEEVVALEAPTASCPQTLESLAQAHPECQRLMTSPGIGPIPATALSAAVGHVGVVKAGRRFAAGLGLAPRQHSTGGQTRLLGISKRGARYVRKLLIHGAGATRRGVERRTDSRSPWRRGLRKRRGWNRTAGAVANRAARIVWALRSRGGVHGETVSRPQQVAAQG
jgi:transposase